MAHQIYLKNKNQVILFEGELVGQISDGFWENSTPHDHWQIPCQAEVLVGELHLTFRPSRGYKFHNKDLFEVVGDRMIFLVKIYMAFPNFLSIVITSMLTWNHILSGLRLNGKVMIPTGIRFSTISRLILGCLLRMPKLGLKPKSIRSSNAVQIFVKSARFSRLLGNKSCENH